MTSASKLSVGNAVRVQASFWREGRLRRAALLCAALAGTAASFALLGWYGQIPRLLRTTPAFPAVQFNSAVCLLLVALALAAVVHGRARTTVVLSLAVLAIAGTTMVEHATGWYAGIDQALWQLGVNREVMGEFANIHDVAPGRMPSNSAAAFSLIAFALTVLAQGRITQVRLLGSSIAALAATTAGAVALAGYIFGIPAAYGWGVSSPMAVTGAITFSVVGLGVLAAIVLTARRTGIPARRVVPVLAATTVAIASLLLWESLRDHDRRTLEIATRHHAKAMGSAMGRSIDERARVVDRMALGRAQRRKGAPGSSGRTGSEGRAGAGRVSEAVRTGASDSAGGAGRARNLAMGQLMRDFPGITSLSLLDENGTIVWHATSSRSPVDTVGSRFDRDNTRLSILQDARLHDRAVVSAPHVAKGEPSTVFIASRTMLAGVHDGFIVAQLEPAVLIADVLPDEFAGQYGYVLKDGTSPLATRGEVDNADARKWAAVVPVDARDRRWQLTITPSAQTMQEFSSGLPTAFLIAALACTLIAAWIVRAAQMAEEQSEKLTRVVTQLAAENEARGLAEALRDQNAELLRAQSAVFERQNEQLHSTAAELAQQRDALAREQEFSAALVRSTVDGIAAFDRTGSIHAWNPAMASLTGRPLAEVEGTAFGNLLPFLNNGEEVRLLQEALHGRATELTAVRATHALWHDEVWMDLTVTPMRTADGTVVGGLLIARDVTESQRVAEVILASKDSAEQANRAKSDFLARMSHELRTPLNAVIGFTNVLLRNRYKRLEKEEITFLERIGANGRHLLTLINEVLDLSKIEAGHETVDIAQTPITKLVRDTIADLEVRATEAGVHLEIDTPLQSYAQTDAAKLKQVLINLVGNAIKFTPSGGSVTVRVISGEMGGEAERIEVQDTGIGIPPDRLEAIFEAFEQADSQTSLTYGGTGLGLAISQKLCELMGHDLVVSSEPGQGSTFTILMKARRSAMAA
ncbi:MAG: ATP-binding protein [bacterium]